MQCVTLDCTNQATVKIVHDNIVEPICAECAYEIGQPVKPLGRRRKEITPSTTQSQS